MISGLVVIFDDSAEVLECQSPFTSDRGASHAFAATQGPSDEDGRMGFAYVREEWFELVCNTREVGIYGLWFDVVGGPNDVEREDVVGWFHGQVVEENEVKVRVESGSVSFSGGEVDSFTQGERSLMAKPLHRPRLAFVLPRSDSWCWDHFSAAPSVHRGG